MEGVRGVLYSPRVMDIHEQAFVKPGARELIRGPNIHSASSRTTHHDSNFESAPFT